MSKWLNERCNTDIWESNEFFDTKEEAIMNGIEQYKAALNGRGTDLFDDDEQFNPSKHFQVGMEQEYMPIVDAEDVIVRITEDAYNECGEVAEDYLSWDEVTDDMQSDLQEMLTDTFIKWSKKYNLMPNFYSIVNVEEINVDDYIKGDENVQDKE